VPPSARTDVLDSAREQVLERGEGLPPDEVLAEVAATRITGRGATRADDRLSEAAMEDRKREGYF